MVDPNQTLAVQAKTAYFSSSNSALASFRSAVSYLKAFSFAVVRWTIGTG